MLHLQDIDLSMQYIGRSYCFVGQLLEIMRERVGGMILVGSLRIAAG